MNKTIAFAFFAMVAFWMTGCASHPPLETAERVDLVRYAGQWHEIGAIPRWFQRGCTATTAEYRLRDDGKVDVVNRCRRGSLQGKPDQVRGVARVVEPSTNAKLKVRFGLIEGDYWILALDEAYQHVLVGTPDRASLWILARTPAMPQETYERLLAVAEARGFDTRKMKRTEQPAQ